jgi:hypothetical protein
MTLKIGKGEDREQVNGSAHVFFMGQGVAMANDSLPLLEIKMWIRKRNL